jgi:hypothetical protein
MHQYRFDFAIDSEMLVLPANELREEPHERNEPAKSRGCFLIQALPPAKSTHVVDVAAGNLSSLATGRVPVSAHASRSSVLRRRIAKG